MEFSVSLQFLLYNSMPRNFFHLLHIYALVFEVHLMAAKLKATPPPNTTTTKLSVQPQLYLLLHKNILKAAFDILIQNTCQKVTIFFNSEIFILCRMDWNCHPFSLPPQLGRISSHRLHRNSLQAQRRICRRSLRFQYPRTRWMGSFQGNPLPTPNS